ncbi:MAG: hypothetical protein MI810_08105 [Flavobacteriales bacterium]|nr:hypothetical protein [Flavobacteriales bacterium]
MRIVKTLGLILISYTSLFAQTMADDRKVIGKDLSNVELGVYNRTEAKSGEMFAVEVIVTFSDGSVLELNKEGKNEKEKSFIYEVSNARSAWGENTKDSPLFYYNYCDSEGSGSITVKVKRSEDRDWLAEKKFPFQCTPDPAIAAKIRDEKEREYELEKSREERKQHVANLSPQEEAAVERLLKEGHITDREEAEDFVILIKQRLEYAKTVEYWRTEDRVPVVKGDEEKVYAIRNSDTLHVYSDYNKNMGLLLDGDRVIRLTSYMGDDLPDDDGNAKNIGFQLFSHDKQNNYESKAGAYGYSYFDEASKSSLVNFKKLESGRYIVISLDQIIVFNEQLETIHKMAASSKSGGKKFLDAIEIPGTKDLAVMYTDNRHNVFIGRYSDEEMLFDVNYMPITRDNYGTGVDVPYTNRMFKADDETFVVFLTRHGADYAGVVKYKFSNLEAEGDRLHQIANKPLWVKTWDYASFLSMSQLPNGKIMVLFTWNGFSMGEIRTEEISRNDIDITVNSEEELMSTLVSYKDNSIKNMNEEGSTNKVYYYPQEDGSLLLLRSEPEGSDFSRQYLLSHYDKDLNFLAKYKLPQPLLAELYAFGYGMNTQVDGGNPFYIYKDDDMDENEHYESGIPSCRLAGKLYDQDIGLYESYTSEKDDNYIEWQRSGVTFTKIPLHYLDRYPKDFFRSRQALDFKLDASGEYLYMTTPFTLEKIELKNVTLAKPFVKTTDKF